MFSYIARVAFLLAITGLITTTNAIEQRNSSPEKKHLRVAAHNREQPRKLQGIIFDKTEWPTYSPTITDEWPTYSPTITAHPTTWYPTTYYPTIVTEAPVTDGPTQAPVTDVPTDSPSTRDPTSSPSSPPTPLTNPTSGTRNFDSGTIGGTSWRDSILGLSNYVNNPTFRPIVVLLDVGEGSNDKYFVGFNERQVTVASLVDGAYSLHGALVAGESTTLTNWRDSGLDLMVMVHELNTDESPSYADVEITFGSQPESSIVASPTGAPTKATTTKPTAKCGNSICDADETPGTCKSDCIAKKFYTRPKPDAKADGQMFTIDATASSGNGIRISSFDAVSQRGGKDECRVYTRPGDYAGYEEDADAWELLLDTKVELEKMYPTSLGLLDPAVSIPAGAKQSFYVWCKEGIMYTQGEKGDEGVSYGSDDSLVIHQGVVTKQLFEKVTGTGKFCAGISYYASASDVPKEDKASRKSKHA